MKQSGGPLVSIVIPVHNESAILRSAVAHLYRGLRELGWSNEVLLVENGSTDDTLSIARALTRDYFNLRAFATDGADYGRALRHGILEAKGRFVICDEIDICDFDFYRRAVPLLESGGAEMVVGSKVMPGSTDRRPLMRRLGTRVLNHLLAIAVGFRGTDTHGLKAFARVAILGVVRECVLDRDLFASELVIRAWRMGRTVMEIPVQLEEKRPPSIGLIRRVPNVLKDLARLLYTLRVRPLLRPRPSCA